MIQSIGSCPTGPAWADKAFALDSAHQPIECSGAGLCNRVDGRCKCFDGYSGAACQRSKILFLLAPIAINRYVYNILCFVDTCPSDCSGHGSCLSMRDMSLFFAPDYDASLVSAGDGNGPIYANWDAQAIMMCRCEYGYFGSDCSQIMCPKGDDPLTINQHDFEFALVVTSNSNVTGTLGVEFQGESIYLDLLNPSSLNCKLAFERSVKFKEISCEFQDISPLEFRYNITVVAWPVLPKENNLYSHQGSPALSEFHCDKVRAGDNVECAFVAARTSNIKGMLLP